MLRRPAFQDHMDQILSVWAFRLLLVMLKPPILIVGVYPAINICFTSFEAKLSG